MVEQAASIAAKEASAEGLKWFFTPMLDVARDPRWGRVAEGFGEDPYLGSQNAAAAVRGYQGSDLAHPEKVAACAKHYAGYGLSYTTFHYSALQGSERLDQGRPGTFSTEVTNTGARTAAEVV